MDAVATKDIKIDGEAVLVPLVAAIYSCMPTSNATIQAVAEVLRRWLNRALVQSGQDGGNRL